MIHATGIIKPLLWINFTGSQNKLQVSFAFIIYPNINAGGFKRNEEISGNLANLIF